MNDSISRQAAIDEFSRCELTPDGGIDANYAIDFLKQLPSTQPEVTEEAVKEYCRKRSLCVVDSELLKKYASAHQERKKGKWIRITQGAMPEKYICPFCHRTVKYYGVEKLLTMRYPYCHCGADMRQV